ncbi:WxL domain-containing protein [Cryobacterium melibiosiphilum]|nr:WxL domain-containing protein [Cryobacterium melibiosiphilum]
MSNWRRALSALVVVSFGTLVGSVAGSALVTPSAAAATDSTDTISVAISGGPLTAVVTAPQAMSPVSLDGLTAQNSVGSASEWTITNARGSGAAWSLSASATDFVSAAGTTDTDARTLPAASLTITPGTVTAFNGGVADAAPTTAPVTMSHEAQALVWSPKLGKGAYALTPTFNLTVPANAYRSNFSADRETSPQNPYVSVLTFTIS